MQSPNPPKAVIALRLQRLLDIHFSHDAILECLSRRGASTNNEGLFGAATTSSIICDGSDGSRLTRHVLAMMQDSEFAAAAVQKPHRNVEELFANYVPFRWLELGDPAICGSHRVRGSDGFSTESLGAVPSSELHTGGSWGTSVLRSPTYSSSNANGSLEVSRRPPRLFEHGFRELELLIQLSHVSSTTPAVAAGGIASAARGSDAAAQGQGYPGTLFLREPASSAVADARRATSLYAAYDDQGAAGLSAVRHPTSVLSVGPVIHDVLHRALRRLLVASFGTEQEDSIREVVVWLVRSVAPWNFADALTRASLCFNVLVDCLPTQNVRLCHLVLETLWHVLNLAAIDGTAVYQECTSELLRMAIEWLYLDAQADRRISALMILCHLVQQGPRCTSLLTLHTKELLIGIWNPLKDSTVAVRECAAMTLEVLLYAAMERELRPRDAVCLGGGNVDAAAVAGGSPASGELFAFAAEAATVALPPVARSPTLDSCSETVAEIHALVAKAVRSVTGSPMLSPTQPTRGDSPIGVSSLDRSALDAMDETALRHAIYPSNSSLAAGSSAETLSASELSGAGAGAFHGGESFGGAGAATTPMSITTATASNASATPVASQRSKANRTWVHQGAEYSDIAVHAGCLALGAYICSSTRLRRTRAEAERAQGGVPAHPSEGTDSRAVKHAGESSAPSEVNETRSGMDTDSSTRLTRSGHDISTRDAAGSGMEGNGFQPFRSFTAPEEAPPLAHGFSRAPGTASKAPHPLPPPEAVEVYGNHTTVESCILSSDALRRVTLACLSPKRSATRMYHESLLPLLALYSPSSFLPFLKDAVQSAIGHASSLAVERESEKRPQQRISEERSRVLLNLLLLIIAADHVVDTSPLLTKDLFRIMHLFVAPNSRCFVPVSSAILAMLVMLMTDAQRLNHEGSIRFLLSCALTAPNVSPSLVTAVRTVFMCCPGVRALCRDGMMRLVSNVLVLVPPAAPSDTQTSRPPQQQQQFSQFSPMHHRQKAPGVAPLAFSNEAPELYELRRNAFYALLHLSDVITWRGSAHFFVHVCAPFLAHPDTLVRELCIACSESLLSSDCYDTEEGNTLPSSFQFAAEAHGAGMHAETYDDVLYFTCKSLPECSPWCCEAATGDGGSGAFGTALPPLLALENSPLNRLLGASSVGGGGTLFPPASFQSGSVGVPQGSTSQSMFPPPQIEHRGRSHVASLRRAVQLLANIAVADPEANLRGAALRSLGASFDAFLAPHDECLNALFDALNDEALQNRLEALRTLSRIAVKCPNVAYPRLGRMFLSTLADVCALARHEQDDGSAVIFLLHLTQCIPTGVRNLYVRQMVEVLHELVSQPDLRSPVVVAVLKLVRFLLAGVSEDDWVLFFPMYPVVVRHACERLGDEAAALEALEMLHLLVKCISSSTSNRAVRSTVPDQWLLDTVNRIHGLLQQRTAPLSINASILCMKLLGSLSAVEPLQPEPFAPQQPVQWAGMLMMSPSELSTSSVHLRDVLGEARVVLDGPNRWSFDVLLYLISVDSGADGIVLSDEDRGVIIRVILEIFKCNTTPATAEYISVFVGPFVRLLEVTVAVATTSSLKATVLQAVLQLLTKSDVPTVVHAYASVIVRVVRSHWDLHEPHMLYRQCQILLVLFNRTAACISQEDAAWFVSELLEGIQLYAFRAPFVELTLCMISCVDALRVASTSSAAVLLVIPAFCQLLQSSYSPSGAVAGVGGADRLPDDIVEEIAATLTVFVLSCDADVFVARVVDACIAQLQVSRERYEAASEIIAGLRSSWLVTKKDLRRKQLIEAELEKRLAPFRTAERLVATASSLVDLAVTYPKLNHSEEKRFPVSVAETADARVQVVASQNAPSPPSGVVTADDRVTNPSRRSAVAPTGRSRSQEVSSLFSSARSLFLAPSSSSKTATTAVAAGRDFPPSRLSHSGRILSGDADLPLWMSPWEAEIVACLCAAAGRCRSFDAYHVSVTESLSRRFGSRSSVLRFFNSCSNPNAQVSLRPRRTATAALGGCGGADVFIVPSEHVSGWATGGGHSEGLVRVVTTRRRSSLYFPSSSDGNGRPELASLYDEPFPSAGVASRQTPTPTTIALDAHTPVPSVLLSGPLPPNPRGRGGPSAAWSNVSTPEKPVARVNVWLPPPAVAGQVGGGQRAPRPPVGDLCDAGGGTQGGTPTPEPQRPKTEPIPVSISREKWRVTTPAGTATSQLPGDGRSVATPAAAPTSNLAAPSVAGVDAAVREAQTLFEQHARNLLADWKSWLEQLCSVLVRDSRMTYIASCYPLIRRHFSVACRIFPYALIAQLMICTAQEKEDWLMALDGFERRHRQSAVVSVHNTTASRRLPGVHMGAAGAADSAGAPVADPRNLSPVEPAGPARVVSAIAHAVPVEILNEICLAVHYIRRDAATLFPDDPSVAERFLPNDMVWRLCRKALFSPLAVLYLERDMTQKHTWENFPVLADEYEHANVTDEVASFLWNPLLWQFFELNGICGVSSRSSSTHRGIGWSAPANVLELLGLFDEAVRKYQTTSSGPSVNPNPLPGARHNMGSFIGAPTALPNHTRTTSAGGILSPMLLPANEPHARRSQPSMVVTPDGVLAPQFPPTPHSRTAMQFSMFAAIPPLTLGGGGDHHGPAQHQPGRKPPTVTAAFAVDPGALAAMLSCQNHLLEFDAVLRAFDLGTRECEAPWSLFQPCATRAMPLEIARHVATAAHGLGQWDTVVDVCKASGVDRLLSQNTHSSFGSFDGGNTAAAAGAPHSMTPSALGTSALSRSGTLKELALLYAASTAALGRFSAAAAVLDTLRPLLVDAATVMHAASIKRKVELSLVFHNMSDLEESMNIYSSLAAVSSDDGDSLTSASASPRALLQRLAYVGARPIPSLCSPLQSLVTLGFRACLVPRRFLVHNTLTVAEKLCRHGYLAAAMRMLREFASDTRLPSPAVRSLLPSTACEGVISDDDREGVRPIVLEIIREAIVAAGKHKGRLSAVHLEIRTLLSSVPQVATLPPKSLVSLFAAPSPLMSTSSAVQYETSSSLNATPITAADPSATATAADANSPLASMRHSASRADLSCHVHIPSSDGGGAGFSDQNARSLERTVLNLQYRSELTMLDLELKRRLFGYDVAPSVRRGRAIVPHPEYFSENSMERPTSFSSTSVAAPLHRVHSGTSGASFARTPSRSAMPPKQRDLREYMELFGDAQVALSLLDGACLSAGQFGTTHKEFSLMYFDVCKLIREEWLETGEVSAHETYQREASKALKALQQAVHYMERVDLPALGATGAAAENSGRASTGAVPGVFADDYPSSPNYGSTAQWSGLPNKRNNRHAPKHRWSSATEALHGSPSTQRRAASSGDAQQRSGGSGYPAARGAPVDYGWGFAPFSSRRRIAAARVHMSITDLLLKIIQLAWNSQRFDEVSLAPDSVSSWALIGPFLAHLATRHHAIERIVVHLCQSSLSFTCQVASYLVASFEDVGTRTLDDVGSSTKETTSASVASPGTRSYSATGANVGATHPRAGGSEKKHSSQTLRSPLLAIDAADLPRTTSFGSNSATTGGCAAPGSGRSPFEAALDEAPTRRLDTPWQPKHSDTPAPLSRVTSTVSKSVTVAALGSGGGGAEAPDASSSFPSGAAPPLRLLCALLAPHVPMETWWAAQLQPSATTDDVRLSSAAMDEKESSWTTHPSQLLAFASRPSTATAAYAPISPELPPSLHMGQQLSSLPGPCFVDGAAGQQRPVEADTPVALRNSSATSVDDIDYMFAAMDILNDDPPPPLTLLRSPPVDTTVVLDPPGARSNIVRPVQPPRHGVSSAALQVPSAKVSPPLSSLACPPMEGTAAHSHRPQLRADATPSAQRSAEGVHSSLARGNTGASAAGSGGAARGAGAVVAKHHPALIAVAKTSPQHRKIVHEALRLARWSATPEVESISFSDDGSGLPTHRAVTQNHPPAASWIAGTRGCPLPTPSWHIRSQFAKPLAHRTTLLSARRVVVPIPAAPFSVEELFLVRLSDGTTMRMHYGLTAENENGYHGVLPPQRPLSETEPSSASPSASPSAGGGGRRSDREIKRHNRGKEPLPTSGDGEARGSATTTARLCRCCPCGPFADRRDVDTYECHPKQSSMPADDATPLSTASTSSAGTSCRGDRVALVPIALMETAVSYLVDSLPLHYARRSLIVPLSRINFVTQLSSLTSATSLVPSSSGVAPARLSVNIAVGSHLKYAPLRNLVVPTLAHLLEAHDLYRSLSTSRNPNAVPVSRSHNIKELAAAFDSGEGDRRVTDDAVEPLDDLPRMFGHVSSLSDNVMLPPPLPRAATADPLPGFPLGVAGDGESRHAAADARATHRSDVLEQQHRAQTRHLSQQQRRRVQTLREHRQRFQGDLCHLFLQEAPDASAWLQNRTSLSRELAEWSMVHYVLDCSCRSPAFMVIDPSSGRVSSMQHAAHCLRPSTSWCDEEGPSPTDRSADVLSPNSAAHRRRLQRNSQPTELSIATRDAVPFRMTTTIEHALPLRSAFTSFVTHAAESLYQMSLVKKELVGVMEYGLEAMRATLPPLSPPTLQPAVPPTTTTTNGFFAASGTLLSEPPPLVTLLPDTQRAKSEIHSAAAPPTPPAALGDRTLRQSRESYEVFGFFGERDGSREGSTTPRDTPLMAQFEQSLSILPGASSALANAREQQQLPLLCGDLAGTAVPGVRHGEPRNSPRCPPLPSLEADETIGTAPVFFCTTAMVRLNEVLELFGRHLRQHHDALGASAPQAQAPERPPVVGASPTTVNDNLDAALGESTSNRPTTNAVSAAAGAANATAASWTSMDDMVSHMRTTAATTIQRAFRRSRVVVERRVPSARSSMTSRPRPGSLAAELPRSDSSDNDGTPSLRPTRSRGKAVFESNETSGAEDGETPRLVPHHERIPPPVLFPGLHYRKVRTFHERVLTLLQAATNDVNVCGADWERCPHPWLSWAPQW